MTARESGRPSGPQSGRGGSFAGTVLLGVVSAVTAAVASNAVWAVRHDAGPSPTAASGLAGSDVVPLVVPLTLVALACWGAVLVLRRRGRRVVAVIGAAAAMTAAVAVVVRVLRADRLDVNAWPWVAAVAAVVSAGALVRAWVAAPGWPEMSGRYDRRGGEEATDDDAPRAETPADLWRAMDEGRDPTT